MAPPKPDSCPELWPQTKGWGDPHCLNWMLPRWYVFEMPGISPLYQNDDLFRGERSHWNVGKTPCLPWPCRLALDFINPSLLDKAWSTFWVTKTQHFVSISWLESFLLALCQWVTCPARHYCWFWTGSFTSLWGSSQVVVDSKWMYKIFNCLEAKLNARTIASLCDCKLSVFSALEVKLQFI